MVSSQMISPELAKDIADTIRRGADKAGGTKVIAELVRYCDGAVCGVCVEGAIAIACGKLPLREIEFKPIYREYSEWELDDWDADLDSELGYWMTLSDVIERMNENNDTFISEYYDSVNDEPTFYIDKLPATIIVEINKAEALITRNDWHLHDWYRQHNHGTAYLSDALWRLNDFTDMTLYEIADWVQSLGKKGAE